MFDGVRGLNSGEDVGSVDVLQNANGGAVPEPAREDLCNVGIANCLAPALDDVGVRTWKPMRDGGTKIWNRKFLNEDAMSSEKPVTATPFLRFCTT